MRNPQRICLTLSLSLAAATLFPLAAVGDDIEKGKAVYNGVGACASCHGSIGKGDGPAAPALNPKPLNFVTGDFKFDTDKDGKTGTEADVLNIVTNGAVAYSGSPLMAARADIPEADRKALAKYIISLRQK